MLNTAATLRWEWSNPLAEFAHLHDELEFVVVEFGVDAVVGLTAGQVRFDLACVSLWDGAPLKAR